MTTKELPLLEIKNLSIGFFANKKVIPAVRHVSLTLNKGETLAIVGESGSGKSATALAITRLLASPPAVYQGGQILFNGVDLLALQEKELCAYRGGRIAYVFQEASTSLNPVYTIRSQMAEMLRLHRSEFHHGPLAKLAAAHQGLARIFHADRLQKSGTMINNALDSDFDLDSRDTLTTSSAQNLSAQHLLKNASTAATKQSPAAVACAKRSDIDAEIIYWLARVGITNPKERLKAYPHQLSGGMQQRVMIAMALSAQPDLLIADEPTTALDVTIQAQILAQLCKLEKDLGMTMILITHNLAIIRGLAHQVAVMHHGSIVEYGPTEEVLQHPQHPYTKALLACIPRLDEHRRRLSTIGKELL